MEELKPGDRFGTLTVICRVPDDADACHQVYECRCLCGGTCVMRRKGITEKGLRIRCCPEGGLFDNSKGL